MERSFFSLFTLLAACLILSAPAADAQVGESKSLLMFEENSCPIGLLEGALVLTPNDMIEAAFELEVALMGANCGANDHACNCAIIAQKCQVPGGFFDRCFCYIGCNITCRGVNPASGQYGRKHWNWTGSCDGSFYR